MQKEVHTKAEENKWMQKAKSASDEKCRADSS